jgi:hypothetical protein
MEMDMNRLFALLACMAWGGVAVSSSSPAHAVAATAQTGDYALCAAYGGATSLSCINEFSYWQQIKFGGAPCSSGGCAPQSATTYTEFKYEAGRHTADPLDVCGAYILYGLGSCAC